MVLGNLDTSSHPVFSYSLSSAVATTATKTKADFAPLCHPVFSSGVQTGVAALFLCCCGLQLFSDIQIFCESLTLLQHILVASALDRRLQLGTLL